MNDFRHQCSAYMDPLSAALKLIKSEVEDYGTHGFMDATRGAVCVRFEHERGLAEFTLSPAMEPRRRWSLLLVAALFPRKRILPGGVQRLSLAEQAELIQSHWAELESLFSPPTLASTIARLEAENDRLLVAAGMKSANKTMEPTR